MTIHDTAVHATADHDASVSRRAVLKAGAGLFIGAYVARGGRIAAQTPPGNGKVNVAPNTFLIIKPDSTVTVLCKHIEMGQGPFSALMHCFTSSRALAEMALGLGFSISFSGVVTFKSSGELRAIARRTRGGMRWRTRARCGSSRRSTDSSS